MADDEKRLALSVIRLTASYFGAFAVSVRIRYSLTMNKSMLFFIFVVVLGGLSLGTVRKAEDPIRDTQTNGILYEQKMEEEKDGKKGPLMYHVKNNPRESFFTDPPFEKEAKSSSKSVAAEKGLPSEDTAGWWEEQPTASQTVPSTERVSEPIPEPLPEAETAQVHEATEPPVATPGDESAPSGKGDDYWW
jgi:hypothetical protein